MGAYRPDMLLCQWTLGSDILPAFQAGRCRVAASKREYPIAFLLGPNGQGGNAQNVELGP